MISRIVTENPTWGAPRIHGELLKLGFDLSERSVSRWVRRAPRNSDPAQRWLTFLKNHREAIAAMESRQVDARLELEQVVRRLCERSRTILALRYAGYTWKEAALLLGSSVPALRSAFWRDVTRVKGELKNHCGAGAEGQAKEQQKGSTSNDASC